MLPCLACCPPLAVCVDVHASWAAFLAFYEQQPGPKKLVGACAGAAAGSNSSRASSAGRLSVAPKAHQPSNASCAGYTKLATQHYAAEGLYPPGSSTWIMLGAETTGTAKWGCWGSAGEVQPARAEGRLSRLA